MIFLVVEFRFFSLYFEKINFFVLSENDIYCLIFIKVFFLIVIKCKFKKVYVL